MIKFGLKAVSSVVVFICLFISPTSGYSQRGNEDPHGWEERVKVALTPDSALTYLPRQPRLGDTVTVTFRWSATDIKDSSVTLNVMPWCPPVATNYVRSSGKSYDMILRRQHEWVTRFVLNDEIDVLYELGVSIGGQALQHNACLMLFTADGLPVRFSLGSLYGHLNAADPIRGELLSEEMRLYPTDTRSWFLSKINESDRVKDTLSFRRDLRREVDSILSSRGNDVDALVGCSGVYRYLLNDSARAAQLRAKAVERAPNGYDAEVIREMRLRKQYMDMPADTAVIKPQLILPVGVYASCSMLHMRAFLDAYHNPGGSEEANADLPFMQWWSEYLPEVK